MPSCCRLWLELLVFLDAIDLVAGRARIYWPVAFKNTWKRSKIAFFRHSREGGNPERPLGDKNLAPFANLNSRLRGNDGHSFLLIRPGEVSIYRSG